jgi:hypothetical protein
LSGADLDTSRSEIDLDTSRSESVNECIVHVTMEIVRDQLIRITVQNIYDCNNVIISSQLKHYYNVASERKDGLHTSSKISDLLATTLTTEEFFETLYSTKIFDEFFHDCFDGNQRLLLQKIVSWIHCIFFGNEKSTHTHTHIPFFFGNDPHTI